MGKQSLKETPSRNSRIAGNENGRWSAPRARGQDGVRLSNLAPQGLAPEVMPSNADFSIGGT